MAENPFLWSVTAADNAAADAAVPWAEGMLPGSVNNSARALMAGVARLLKDMNGTVATTGSANTYAVTSNCSHTAYANGILITARANFTNTAAATLNLNTYGVKNIRVMGTSGEAAVAAGQIQSGGTYNFRYDSAADSAAGAFILLNPSPDPTATIAIGDVKIWPTDTLPTGYLWANGAAQSRTTYAALFAVIGTTYGVGDGSTTFNVLDLCGRAPFGSDDMGGITLKSRVTNAGCGIVGTTLGASGGVESVTLSTTQIPSHTHTGTTAAGGSHTHTGTTDAESAHTHTGTTATVSANHQHTFPYGITTFAGGGTFGITTIGSGASSQTTSIETADHIHSFTSNAGSAHTHTFTTAASSTHTHTFTSDATGGGLLHSNMPPALIVNYVIRY